MPSWPQILILITVIVLLFGTKKLRTLGEDLGAAIKGFKKALNDETEENKAEAEDPATIEKKSTETTKHK